MTWRGSTTPLDRVFACLVYLLPLIEAVLFYGSPFFRQFPELTILLIPLQPFIFVYQLFVGLFAFGGISLGGLIIFFGLYFLVVRNESIRHFVRFNTMQAIMLGIAMSLFGVVWIYIFEPFMGGGLIEETLFNVIFLGTVIAVVYSIVQSVIGRYAEIPTLSDAVYMQVR
ncbi:MAG: Tic20 family protein [Elainellaceae cyanobacterium]